MRHILIIAALTATFSAPAFAGVKTACNNAGQCIYINEEGKVVKRPTQKVEKEPHKAIPKGYMRINGNLVKL